MTKCRLPSSLNPRTQTVQQRTSAQQREYKGQESAAADQRDQERNRCRKPGNQEDDQIRETPEQQQVNIQAR